MLMFSITCASQFEAFLGNGIGINSIAMGQAYFNISDVESSFYNPALLSRVDKLQFKIVSNKKLEGLDELYASIAIPLPLATIGITYFNSQLKNSIAGTSYDSNTDTITATGLSHSYFTSLLMFTLSRECLDRILIGVNIKNYNKNLVTG